MLEILQLYISIKPNQHLEIHPWGYLWSRRNRSTTLAEAISEECSLIHQPFGIPGVSSGGSTSGIVTSEHHDTMTCHSELTTHSNIYSKYFHINKIIEFHRTHTLCALSTISELHVLYGEFSTLSMHCSQSWVFFSWVFYQAGIAAGEVVSGEAKSRKGCGEHQSPLWPVNTISNQVISAYWQWVSHVFALSDSILPINDHVSCQYWCSFLSQEWKHLHTPGAALYWMLRNGQSVLSKKWQTLTQMAELKQLCSRV